MAELSTHQRARLQKAERFLLTARLALRDEDFESCVSRSYYVIFHSACALILDERIELKHISHEELIRQIIRWNNSRTRLRNIGNLDSRHTGLNQSLTGLLRWRNDADYEMEKTTKDRAQNSMMFAAQMLGVIKEVLQ